VTAAIELQAPPRPVRVTAMRSPFRQARIELAFAEGSTIATMVAAAGLSPTSTRLAAYVGDRLVPESEWLTTRPRAGDIVCVRALPLGNEGESGGKTALRIVALLAVVVLSIVTFGAGTAFAGAYGATASAIAVGVASIAGSLAVNALIPPPKLEPPKQVNSKGQSLISATRNEMRPYEQLPRVYGTFTMFPPLGAIPFQSVSAKKAFFHQVFVIGRGPCNLADLRIGTSPLFKDTTTLVYTGKMRSDSGRFAECDVELRQGRDDDEPLTLFGDEVHTDAFSKRLIGKKTSSHINQVTHVRVTDTVKEAVPQEARSRIDAEELEVEVQWPLGVGENKADGTSKAVTIKVNVEYAPVGGAYTDRDKDGHKIDDIEISEDAGALRMRSRRWPVAKGQYDVRLTRKTPELDADGSGDVIDTTIWVTLKTIRKGTPINLPGLCVVAMRIKATNQLNGIVDTFSARVTSILRKWNGATWEEAATGNCAAVYRDICQGASNKVPATDAQLDLTALQEWSEDCDAEQRSFNGIFDTEGDAVSRLRLVCSVGRASFTMVDMKASVVRDLADGAPKQLFTTRNSWGFKGTLLFPELPHALKCRFVNARKPGVIQDEQIVYRDGYDAKGEGGNTAATLFETMDFPGYTDPGLVWADARYHLAIAELRPEIYEVNLDVENLRSRRGDPATLSNDVMVETRGSCRVKALVLSGSDVSGVELQDPIVMDGAKTYAVRYRKGNFDIFLKTLTTVAGSQSTVMFASAITVAGQKPEVGDLLAWGESGSVDTPVIITKVLPGPDLTARVVMVDQAPDVLLADQGARPPWAVEATGEVPADSRAPTDETPIIEDVSTDAVEPIPAPAEQPATQADILAQQLAYAIQNPMPEGLIVIAVKKPKKKKNK
jgi:hypothetical protein